MQITRQSRIYRRLKVDIDYIPNRPYTPKAEIRVYDPLTGRHWYDHEFVRSWAEAKAAGARARLEAAVELAVEAAGPECTGAAIYPDQGRAELEF